MLRSIEVYLRECYRTETAARVSELSAQLGLHRASLFRAAAVLGQPLRDAMRDLQLEYAATLLTDTSKPVAAVALAAAFGQSGLSSAASSARSASHPPCIAKTRSRKNAPNVSRRATGVSLRCPHSSFPSGRHDR